MKSNEGFHSGRTVCAVAVAVLLLPYQGWKSNEKAHAGEARQQNPAEVDVDQTSLNQLRGRPTDLHGLIIDETTEAFDAGTIQDAAVSRHPPGVIADCTGSPGDPPHTASFTSRRIATPFPFNEFIPSYNAEVPEGATVCISVRAGRTMDDFWTAYFDFGCWPNESRIPNRSQPHVEDEQGRVNIDVFRSAETFDRLQYRVDMITPAADKAPTLKRFAIAFSNTTGDTELAAKHHEPTDDPPAATWQRRLDVPFRSQKSQPPELRSRICSPTSVSMVMAFHQVDQPISRVAEFVYDPAHRIYGNWLRAVQASAHFGVPGYIQRFKAIDELKPHIAAGRPVIISIRANPGELTGAPYSHTDGHLLVVTGFEKSGDIHVNDPAGETEAEGQRSYRADELHRTWIERGGVGYVLCPPRP